MNSKPFLWYIYGPKCFLSLSWDVIIPAVLRMLFSPEEFLEHITDIATIICS